MGENTADWATTDALRRAELRVLAAARAIYDAAEEISATLREELDAAVEQLHTAETLDRLKREWDGTEVRA